MARAPDKRIEQAKALYLQGKKLVDIAEALGLPEGTVRSWKNRYNVIRQIIWSRFRQFIWMCSQVQIAYWSG